MPPKSRLSVLGNEVEYVCAGNGPCAIVLINGAGGPIEGWYKVYADLSAHAKVLAYNRPGIGGSAQARCPQTGLRMVEALRGLLQALELAPPYVLVGHSLGGLILNLFARLHPQEVAAAVFLEATSPDDVGVMAQHESAVQKLLKALLNKIAPLHPFAEMRSVDAIVAELAAAPPFPPIPLTVITGGKPAMAWATPAQALQARARHQAALAGLSPKGRQVMAPGSGHFPQLSEPQQVVAEVLALASHVP